MDIKNYTELESQTIRLTNVPVVYADRPGRNKNLYPEDELIAAVTWWEKIINLDPTYKYSLIKHPKDTSEETYEYVAGIIEKIYYDYENKVLRGDFKLLPTTWGLLISYLASKGHPVGVSLRGDADPTYSSMQFNNKQMDITIRKNLKLEGIDFVLYPSFITTQISPNNVTENRKKVNKVLEGFKQEYKNILKEDELDRINTLYINENLENIEINKLNKRGGNNMANEIKTDILEKEKIGETNEFDMEKSVFKKEKLEFEIDKLSDKKIALESSIADAQVKFDSTIQDITTKTETAKTELANISKDIGGKTSELDAVLKAKMKFEEEITAKKTELEVLAKEIEAKQTEINEIKELVVLESKSSKTNISIKKGKKVFDSENIPKIRIVEPEERLSNSKWDSIDKDELRKIAYLAKDKAFNKCFGIIDTEAEGWDAYKYPICQLFPSDDEAYDFDAVLNTQGLKTAVAFMQGRAGMSLSQPNKKALSKFFVNAYKKLEEIGKGETPPSLKKFAESRVIFETSSPYLDTLLDGLILDNIIDLDDSEVTESANTDEEIIVKIDDENTQQTLQKVAIAMSSILGIQEEIPPTDDTIVVNNNKISDEDAARVMEQFNPDDTSLDLNKEITEFVGYLLTNSDNSQTPFAQTYDLSNGGDVYAMFGVVRDGFVNGDFTTAFQIMKGLTGTLFVRLSGLSESNSITPASTEQAGDTAAPAKSLTNVQIINYAFNMSTLILSKYDEIQNIFTSIGGESVAPTDVPTEIAPELPPTDNAIPSMEQTQPQPQQSKNKIYEKLNFNGGNSMDINKLIDMVKENFESAEEINESNIFDAVGSVLTDYVALSEKYAKLEAEHTKLTEEITAKEIQSLKDEKTKTLESLGVEKSAIDEAFAAVNTAEEIESKFSEFQKVVESVKVTESTHKKVTLTRKGTANPDEIIENTTKPVDQFDKLMANI